MDYRKGCHAKAKKLCRVNNLVALCKFYTKPRSALESAQLCYVKFTRSHRFKGPKRSVCKAMVFSSRGSSAHRPDRLRGGMRKRKRSERSRQLIENKDRLFSHEAESRQLAEKMNLK
jgi:hypothetical protein